MEAKKYFKPIKLKIPETPEIKIDIEKKFIQDLSIQDKLDEEKSKIELCENFDRIKWIRFHKKTDYSLIAKKLYRKKFHNTPISGKIITNAFLKLSEILKYFRINKVKTITAFHICELPGGFIFAAKNYFEKYYWYAQSLFPKTESTLGDTFGLYRKYPSRWLMDENHDGDILNPENLLFYKEKLPRVNFITSDCGIYSTDYDKQELQNINLSFAQMIYIINLLADGGNAVMKIFTLYYKINKDIVIILSHLFKKFYLFKPLSSRPRNSEIYFVGIGFKQNPELIKKLTEFYIKNSRVPLDNYSFLKEKDYESQYKLINRFNKYMCERQTYFIKKNIKQWTKFRDNPKEIEKHLKKYEKIMEQYIVI